MPTYHSHVGVAFYNFPGFPPQWVLVLSENRRFEGKVWCNSAIETVDGWRESSKKCTRSLAALDPTTVLSGVVHVGSSPVPVRKLLGAVAKCVFPSEPGKNWLVPDLDMPEKYVTRVLLQLCRGRSLRLPTLDAIVLADMIRERASILREKAEQNATVDNKFPVVRLLKRGL
jgi:hypothetical protein